MEKAESAKPLNGQRILVTGVNGFVGSHFAELATSNGAQVVGTVRIRSNISTLVNLFDNPRLSLAHCELTDPTSVHDLVVGSGFTHIIHLAAQSFVGASWDQPFFTLDNNIRAQLNLLEAVRESDSPPRFLVIGSSEEYGLVHETELPITEAQPLRPLSPYAVSKVTQDMLGYQYWKSYGLPIVRARAFNHEGPRRGEQFVTSNFARQVIKAADWGKGHVGPAPIYVGDLTTRRDFTDVRDIVRGYYDLLVRGTVGEVYNLCSGQDWEIGDMLDILIGKVGLTEDQIEIRVDHSRLRPSDVPVLRGSYGKIKSELGWEPTIPFKKTLQDILDYWLWRS